MKKYIVIERPFFLSDGILELTKGQYQSRKQCLEPLKKGLYRVAGAVCFKVGEKIGFDGKISKAVQFNLVSPEEYKAKGIQAGSVEIDPDEADALKAANAKIKDLEIELEELREVVRHYETEAMPVVDPVEPVQGKKGKSKGTL